MFSDEAFNTISGVGVIGRYILQINIFKNQGEKVVNNCGVTSFTLQTEFEAYFLVDYKCNYSVVYTQHNLFLH